MNIFNNYQNLNFSFEKLIIISIVNFITILYRSIISAYIRATFYIIENFNKIQWSFVCFF